MNKTKSTFFSIIFLAVLASMMLGTVSNAAQYSQANEAWFSDFKLKTVVSTGTNGRLDNFIEKLNRGEHVIVVCNGGSITEGVGTTDLQYSYADRFISGLKERYPKAQIEYLNVGISSQPSSIGIMNYDKDITLALQNRVPDLVIIEYAVNDAVDATFTSGYESMIRKALGKGDTAVILVMSEFKSGYNKQDEYIPIGNHYGLPMMSIKNALDDALATGLVTESQYFWDDLHPTDYGHFLMSEGLLQVIDLKQAEIKKYGKTAIKSIPDNCVYSAFFTNLNLLTANYEVTSNNNGAASIVQGTLADCSFNCGSFKSRDLEIRGARRFSVNPFTDNLLHEAGLGNDPLTLTCNCKNIIINYKTSPSPEYGKVMVYLDDQLVGYLNGYDAYGYNNSNALVIFNSDVSALHTLTIKMAPDSENKKFTILNLAYTP